MNQENPKYNHGEKMNNPIERFFRRSVASVLVITTLVFGIPINPPRFLPDEAKQLIQRIFGLPDANAFQIKRVQKGSVQMGSTAINATGTIPVVARIRWVGISAAIVLLKAPLLRGDAVWVEGGTLCRLA